MKRPSPARELVSAAGSLVDAGDVEGARAFLELALGGDPADPGLRLLRDRVAGLDRLAGAADRRGRGARLGARVGGYTLLDLIDVSTLGEAWLAGQNEAPGHGRLARLLRVAPAWWPRGAWCAGRAAALREAFALRAPGVDPLLEVIENDTGAWAVYEPFEGHSLRELIDSGPRLGLPFPEDLLLAVLERVCEALDAVRDRGADGPAPLTPALVMVGYDGRVRLTGFGLVTAPAARFGPADQLAALGQMLLEGLAGEPALGSAAERLPFRVRAGRSGGRGPRLSAPVSALLATCFGTGAHVAGPAELGEVVSRLRARGPGLTLGEYMRLAIQWRQRCAASLLLRARPPARPAASRPNPPSGRTNQPAPPAP